MGDILDKMKAQIDWKSIRVLFEIEKKFPPVVADFKILQRIVTALMENAIEASKHGAIVRVNVSEEPEEAIIAITDFGEWIDPRDFKSLFVPFTIIQFTPSPKRGKMILNLPIVKILVELLEGKIWVESQKGVDTTFFFSLPLAGQQPVF
jgi:signal transduction histidine kinase